MTKKKETIEEITEAQETEQTPEAWNVKRTLQYGNEGDDVRELQAALVEHGYGCGNERGQFGASTKIAIRAFQSAVGVPINGIAGRQTITALGGEYKA